MTEKIKKMPQIGEVYLMKFDGKENEQQGWRPGLVFQNNVGNRFSPNIIALPLTSAIKKSSQPTHVYVNAEEAGLRYDSLVLCENPQRMTKSNIGAYLTTMPHHYMRMIAEANLLASGAIAYLTPELLLNAYKKAVALNTVDVGA